MTLFKLVSSAVLAASVSAAAFAHSGATGIIKERMDGMGIMKDSMKVLAPMMQGKVPYDAAAVRKEAGEIEAHAGSVLTALFPQGSEGHPSEAKADIWEDWDSFASLAAELQLYSKGLAAAAANGLGVPEAQSGGMMSGSMMMGATAAEAVPSAEALTQMPADTVFTMLSQTCSSCHTRFRAE